jgi:hypothetical protein
VGIPTVAVLAGILINKRQLERFERHMDDEFDSLRAEIRSLRAEIVSMRSEMAGPRSETSAR